MSALTTRLSLYKPGGGSTGTILPDETADIDKLNDNFDDIDAAIGATVCTSGTRPATPYDGQIIYETDTDKLLVRVQGTASWDELSATADITTLQGRVTVLEGGSTLFSVADLDALPAAGGITEGRLMHVDSMGCDFQVRDGAWVQVGPSSFATAADRTTEYAKASAAYLIQGATSILATDPSYVWEYLAAYHISSNPGGANPAGWYPPNGQIIAQDDIYNSGITILTTTPTAYTGLSAIGRAPGTPLSLSFETAVLNSASGAARTGTTQFFEDSTGLGTARTWGWTLDVGLKGMVHTYPYTPAAGIYTWTVKVNCSANTACGWYDGRITVRAVVPRS